MPYLRFWPLKMGHGMSEKMRYFAIFCSTGREKRKDVNEKCREDLSTLTSASRKIFTPEISLTVKLVIFDQLERFNDRRLI